MTQWMYYLVAIVAAGFVLFMVSKLTVEGQQTAVHATSFQFVKQKQFAVIQTVERDFRNLGASKLNMTDAILRMDMKCPENNANNWCRFDFWTRVDDDTLLADPSAGLVNAANRDSIVVRYRWRHRYPDAGEISDMDKIDAFAMEKIMLLQWERQISTTGTGGWATTHAIDTFHDFNIVPFNLAGTEITVAAGNGIDSAASASTRRFYIEIEAKTPQGTGKDDIDISRWETFIRPVNLTRLDQEVEE